MKAAEWIDKAKSLRGIESDYGIAKAIGLSRQTVSSYRNKIATLDEETAVRIAKFIGAPPEAIILDQAAERVKSPELRAALLKSIQRLYIM
ncbi:helix-turn-helix domain-containing protein [Acidovorax sp. Q11]